MVGCPETSLIDNKQFNINVVTPHELFMALEPEAFPWESKVHSDFNKILPRAQSLYTHTTITIE
jgi:diphthamide synthase subunit DPH2